MSGERSSDVAMDMGREPRPQLVGPWLALPLGQRRLTIAVGSRRAAALGLRLYQPVTFGGLGLWMSARIAAATGGLRLIGDRRRPPLADLIAPYLPTGGSLSLTINRREDRAVALLLDAGGRAMAIAKVALDDAGRAKLANEAQGLRRAALRLRPPLAAPAVLSQEPGVLILEAASWRVRLRPWILPTDVAASLGHLFREGGVAGPHGQGFGHGDVAPWNLLRTDTGWCLLDWEEASESAAMFEDPLHYLVQSHALLGRPSGGDLLAGLRGAGWIGDALRAYASAAQLDLSSLPEAFATYLGRSRALLHPDQPDGRRGLLARDRLLAEFRAMK